MNARAAGRRPKKAIVWIGAGVVALAVAAFLLIYFLVFPTSSPKPFKLTPSKTTATTTAATTTASSPSSDLSGSWKISHGSLAGYRVREKLAFLPADSDAVGRTSQVSGTAAFAQSAQKVTVEKAAFSVAVDTLTSDRSMRDEKIHQIGLESDRFPTATFKLSKPVELSRGAIVGQVEKVTATGVFDIHGVSKSETFPLEISLSGSTLEAAGSLTFPWGEFGMVAPSIGGFVNVTDTATLEFDLRLQHT
jgi:polyisoprenoid-binding protein YceI